MGQPGTRGPPHPFNVPNCEKVIGLYNCMYASDFTGQKCYWQAGDNKCNNVGSGGPHMPMGGMGGPMMGPPGFGMPFMGPGGFGGYPMHPMFMNFDSPDKHSPFLAETNNQNTAEPQLHLFHYGQTMCGGAQQDQCSGICQWVSSTSLCEVTPQFRVAFGQNNKIPDLHATHQTSEKEEAVERPLFLATVAGLTSLVFCVLLFIIHRATARPEMSSHFSRKLQQDV